MGRGQNEITPVTICYSLREWARGDTSSQTCSFSHSETAIIHFVWESCCKIFLWLSIKIQREAATASHFVKCIFCGWDNFWTCIVASSKLWYRQTSFTSLFEVSSLVVGHGDVERVPDVSKLCMNHHWEEAEQPAAEWRDFISVLVPSFLFIKPEKVGIYLNLNLFSLSKQYAGQIFCTASVLVVEFV